MAKSLRAAIIKLQGYAKDAGAKSAPDDPTASAMSFPFSVAYPGKPNLITGQANVDRKDLMTVFLDFHVALQLLPANVRTAIEFYEQFPTYLINDPRLGGTVDTIRLDEGISAEFGEMKYNDKKTVGWRFRIPVKILHSDS